MSDILKSKGLMEQNWSSSDTFSVLRVLIWAKKNEYNMEKEWLLSSKENHLRTWTRVELVKFSCESHFIQKPWKF